MVIIKMYLMASCVSCFRKAHSLGCFFQCPVIRPVNESRRDGMANWIPFCIGSQRRGCVSVVNGVIHLSSSLLCYANFLETK